MYSFPVNFSVWIEVYAVSRRGLLLRSFDLLFNYQLMGDGNYGFSIVYVV